MKKLVRKLGRWQWWIKGLIALSLIAMATVVGLASMMFPWLLSHPEKVRAFLAEQLQRPVQFAELSGEWRARGPVFGLKDLRIGGDGGAPPLGIGSAELAFDFYAPLFRGRSWYEIKIVAPVIDLHRDVSRQWQIRQWAGGGAFDLAALRGLGSIGMRDARINLSDAQSGGMLHLVDVALSVGEGGRGRLVSASLRAEGGAVPVQLACDLDTSFANGRCYVRGRDLLIDDWLTDWPIRSVTAQGGKLAVDAWIDLLDFQPQSAQLELSAEEVIWRGLRLVTLSNGQTVEPRHSPEHLALAMRWQRQSDAGWQLSLIEGDRIDAVDEAGQSRLHMIGAMGASDEYSLSVEVQSLRLERVLPWLALSDALPPAMAGALYESAPSGELHDLSWQRSGQTSRLIGQFRELGLHATRKLPSLQGLSGQLRGDERATLIRLDAVDSDFSYPAMFRQALPIRMDPLLIALTPQSQGWRIDFDQLHVRGDQYEVEGHLALEFSEGGGKPFMEGVVRVLPGSVPAAKAVWPVGIMPATTVAWLDRALESGRIESGMAVIRGDLDDWPFTGDEGRFDSVATIHDTRVKFHPQWPAAQLRSATAHFINNSMLIEIASAEIQGNTLNASTARIEDMKQPLLRIEAHSSGQSEALLDLVRASPLQQKHGAELLGVGIKGAADVDMVLQQPLKAELGPGSVDGRVLLHDADLVDLKWKLKFDKASGSVRFNEAGFIADALNVRIEDHVAELNIAVGEYVADEGNLLEASLRGELSVAGVMSGFDAMSPYFSLFPGQANWDTTLIVSLPDAQGVSSKKLLLSSDLRGIAINLPAPLRKDADTSMPFVLDMSLPIDGSEITMQLGQLARFRALAATEERALSGHIALGGGLADALPESGIRISGEAPAIDLGGWAGMGAGGDGASLPLEVEVRAEEVDILGRAFADTGVRISRTAGRSQIQLQGQGIDGGFEMASVNSDLLGITARFKTLHWPEARPTSVSHPLDPSLIPPLHIWVGDLRLGEAGFGEARIETRPGDSGMHIEEITTRSPTLTMRASGSWQLKPEGEESALDITFSAEDIGKMLSGLGYESGIEGGQTVATLNGIWKGSPAQFGLHRVRGTLQGEVGSGRILDVEPGAGRLFGLVNFASIPRRLTLDFSDFFKSGLAFDSIEGSFDLNEGDATTADLKLKAPSADIEIKGRAGLITRDYDQQMEVVPRVRSALPLVGAVAGGPIGAVVGVLAQDVLRKPLDGIVTARYSVKGSWDKPDVVLIAKEKRPLPEPPAGG